MLVLSINLHQGGETMVPQGVLPFQYKVDDTPTGMTALAGLPSYLDLAHVMGLRDSIARHVTAREGEQGWTDAQVVTALMLLNIAGGDGVDDLKVLEKDEGFAEVLRRTETHGLPRHERRELLKRWRKERKRAVPSPSSVWRYLDRFHDPEQEKKREEGKAFIPAPTESLLGLHRVNTDLLSFVQSRRPQREATLDQDATLVETHKKEALYCYKHFKAYQPLNTWWAEQGLIVHSEFRDGNVPAGHEQLRVLQEASACLPEGVEKVSLRSDTAGYQQELIRYCAEGKDERFGVIDYAIGVDVTPEFKKAVAVVPEAEWHALYREVDGQKQDTGQQWAEVCFVPGWTCRNNAEATYRYLAIREPLRQLSLPGTEDRQQSFPFPTLTFSTGTTYKVFGVVTNRDLPGDELIWWHRQRCGKSEEVHAVMKDDLAGGKLPSKYFGVNAAWWAIMILALNLNVTMKRLVLGREWEPKRMKAVRFALINLPGRVVHHARRLIIRLSGGHPSADLLLNIRVRIRELANAPSG